MNSTISRLILLCIVFLQGCVNPINRQTAFRYSEACHEAEKANELLRAEELCSRSLKNVEWGNLGGGPESYAMLNLGRIERKLGKFSEAEALLMRSLDWERSHGNSVSVGLRLGEMAILKLAEDKPLEGIPYIEELASDSSPLDKANKGIVLDLLMRYEEKVRATNSLLADQLSGLAKDLGTE